MEEERRLCYVAMTRAKERLSDLRGPADALRPHLRQPALPLRGRDSQTFVEKSGRNFLSENDGEGQRVLPTAAERRKAAAIFQGAGALRWRSTTHGYAAGLSPPPAAPPADRARWEGPCPLPEGGTW